MIQIYTVIVAQKCTTLLFLIIGVLENEGMRGRGPK